MEVETFAAAIQGDEPACRDLFGLWYPKAYRIAKSICGKKGCAEDAVQEALIRFWKALPRLKNLDTADRFFYITVANEARRMQQGRKIRTVGLGDDEPLAGSDGPSGDDMREAQMELRNAVEKLPEKMKSAVKLHYYGGFAETETAELLGVSLSSVKMRLMRARQKLRSALEQSGYEVMKG